MKRSFIEIWVRLLIVTASTFAFALYGGNLVHCFNEYGPLLDRRFGHDDSGGRFLLTTP